MTRGKHGAKAAIRRAEAAHEHIDRLTNDLVAAKLRARQYEAAARRLPAVESELSKVRRERDEGAAPEIERLTEMVERLRMERDDAVASSDAICEKWERAIEHFRTLFPERMTGSDFFGELGVAIGGERIGVLEHAHQRKLGDEGVRRLQRARGELRGTHALIDEKGA